MSDAQLPVVVFDVDGVFNIVNLREVLELTRPEVQFGVVNSPPTEREPRGQSSKIAFSPEVVRAANRLTDENLAEVFWLSAWRSEVAALTQIGLNAFEEIVEPDFDTQVTGWWKTDAMMGLLESRFAGRKVIWVDDDLKTEPEALMWSAGNGVVTVSPVSIRGISVDEIEFIIREVTK